MEFVWYGLGFVALVMVGTRIAVLRAFLRLRLRAADAALVPAEAVPAGLREALADEAARLLPGFVLRAWLRTVSIDVDDQRPLHSALLQDGDGTWAVVFPHGTPEPGFACNVILATPLADGRIACTALWDVEYACFGGLLIVLTAWSGLDSVLAADEHRVALARLGVPAERIDDPVALNARFAVAWDDVPGRLAGSGWRREGDRVRPGLRAAWRLASRFLAAHRRCARDLAAARRHGPLPLVPAAIDVDALARQVAREPSARAGGGLVLLLLSLVAFIAIGTVQFEPLALAALLGVLLLHEGGHWLAMRAFGYRDLSMFFLPLLGAAVTGRKRDASAVQQVLVSLAGPLPGLALGMVLMLGADDPLQRLVAWMLIAVNWSNLLPVLPFDGGHVLRTLLFARHAWLDVLFHAVAVLALLAIGWWLAPILVALGVMLALGLPQQWRTAGFLQRLRREVGPRPGGAAPELAVLVAERQAAAPALAVRPFVGRLQLVRTAIERLTQPAAGLPATVGLLALWLIALAVPPVVFLLPRILTP